MPQPSAVPLLTALDGGGDRADAVTVDGRSCAYEELLGAAGAVARRVAGAGAFAVEATASLETV
ncbi:MAG TPA: acyl-CoA synthetase, partial [Streptomyces sp.]